MGGIFSHFFRCFSVLTPPPFDLSSPAITSHKNQPERSQSSSVAFSYSAIPTYCPSSVHSLNSTKHSHHSTQSLSDQNVAIDKPQPSNQRRFSTSSNPVAIRNRPNLSMHSSFPYSSTTQFFPEAAAIDSLQIFQECQLSTTISSHRSALSSSYPTAQIPQPAQSSSDSDGIGSSQISQQDQLYTTISSHRSTLSSSYPAAQIPQPAQSSSDPDVICSTQISLQHKFQSLSHPAQSQHHSALSTSHEAVPSQSQVQFFPDQTKVVYSRPAGPSHPAILPLPLTYPAVSFFQQPDQLSPNLVVRDFSQFSQQCYLQAPLVPIEHYYPPVQYFPLVNLPFQQPQILLPQQGTPSLPQPSALSNRSFPRKEIATGPRKVRIYIKLIQIQGKTWSTLAVKS